MSYAKLLKIDLTFDGVDKSNTERKKHLYPYSTVNIMDALSHKAMKKRVNLVEGAILKCMKP